MKRVLVIAYYFPPLGMGGVRRVVNFCKYLPNFGFKPIVMTVKDIAYFAQDNELAKEIRCPVYRSNSLDPLRLMKILSTGTKDFGFVRAKYQGVGNFLFLPDNKIGWLSFGVKLGLKLIRQNKIDIIFATAPPYTGLVMGWLLKKISGLPLVIEFRDPWPYFPYPTCVHKWIGNRLKNKVIADADAIISVNEHIKLSLLSEYRRQKTGDRRQETEDRRQETGDRRQKTGDRKIEVIPPGYSPDDFPKSFERNKPKDKFTILYTGAFIPPRTPLYFLKAISTLITNGQIKMSDIRVEIIGFCDEKVKSIANDLNLAEVVSFKPYQTHKYCLERIIATDILWIMMDEMETGASTGKIGEYLGAGRPILATIPDSPCADIIRKTNIGVVVPPRDINAIADAIYELFLKSKQGVISELPISMVEKYSYVYLTSKLANIFSRLTWRGHHPRQPPPALQEK
ncbi:MAG: glycosyltransferase [Candidatus Stahlbacteria bacterium]|nr:glycosyltransferase [Candidatus Stahlbacteria bacterium]